MDQEKLMKKIILFIIALLTVLSLSACNQNSQKDILHHSAKATFVRKKAKKRKAIRKKEKLEKAKAKKERKEKAAKAAASKKQIEQQQAAQQAQQNSAQKQNNQQNATRSQPPMTQGEINMQRGYDPNGAPLLPGQDHAAGSNPDGPPDAWVQGQLEWAIRNGLMNPDGSDTEKGKELEQQTQY